LRSLFLFKNEYFTTLMKVKRRREIILRVAFYFDFALYFQFARFCGEIA
jgi:hypothetical protein